MEKSNKFFKFSDAGYPLMVFEIFPNEPTSNEIEDFLSCQKHCISQPDKVIVVYKAESLKYLSAETRIKFGNWNKQFKSQISEKVKGLAFQIDSLIGKMMLKAIFVIETPGVPYTVVSSNAEIESWLSKYK